ncbi:acetyltransferase [Acidisphaera sp. S103]|uniref:acetyltransferase n=1 Tax=Acidisphaera sp. S103 TaxID=1747223 RepID=UPI00131A7324|nr:acetyltransferase [Acidisphaera sp. S103]
MATPRHIYGLVGAGGSGREVMPLLRAQLAAQLDAGQAEVVFVVEGDPPVSHVNGIRVERLETFLAHPQPRSFNVSIGNSRVRERIAGLCETAGAMPVSIIAPTAVVLDECEFGEGAVLCSFALVTSNVRVGRFFHANMYSHVAHDCVLGDFVTLAPKAAINGRIQIGDHAYIGTGAVTREGQPGNPLRIGRGAVVGMGAVVTRDVPEGATVIGNPARLR